MFKKTLTFIAAVALVLTLVGCSGTPSTDATGTGEQTTQAPKPESGSTKPQA